tara:strand:+ start:180 stop:554 length:375 start_codon:yes stop_codon:yes gene_type:complete
MCLCWTELLRRRQLSGPRKIEQRRLIKREDADSMTKDLLQEGGLFSQTKISDLSKRSGHRLEGTLLFVARRCALADEYERIFLFGLVKHLVEQACFSEPALAFKTKNRGVLWVAAGCVVEECCT